MWTIKLFSVHSQTCAAVTQSPQKKPCTPQLRLSIHHPPSLRQAAAPPPAFGGGARGLWTPPHAATRLGRLCVCVFPDSAPRHGAAGRLVPSARGGIDIRLQGQAAFHSATQHVVDLWASPRLGRYNKASVDARGRASRGPALLFVLDTRLQAGRGGARLERSEQGRAIAGSGCTVSLSHRLCEGSSCFGITLRSKPTRHPPPTHHTHRGCPSSSESRSWAYELRDSASTQPPSPPPPPPHAV